MDGRVKPNAQCKASTEIIKQLDISVQLTSRKRAVNYSSHAGEHSHPFSGAGVDMEKFPQ